MTRMLSLPSSVLVLAFAGGCTSEPASVPNDASTDSESATFAVPKPTSDDPKVQQGWSSVVKRNCAGCHQSPNPSDGVLSGQNAPVAHTTAYGSNLTPDPDTGMDSWDTAKVVRALRVGVDNQGQPLCPAMPKYPNLSDDEGNAIAAYLVSLTAVHHDIPKSVCPPIEPRQDAGTDADAASDAALDGATDADAGPCAPSVGEFSKCDYIVNLPCGASFEQRDCYLLLSDCANICTFGSANCHYATGCDGGTMTASPTDPAQVECFIPTSVICGFGVDVDL
jgi:mono/diheme cytochrome c family protein